MGTTNEIKSTNIGQSLIGKLCQECNKNFTDKDICEDNNWEVQFDTSNEVELKEHPKEGYNLTIQIKNIYHEFCPSEEEVEKVKEEIKRSINKEVKEKTEWQKLGDRIKKSHPLETYNESLRKIGELRKKKKLE